MNLHVHCHEKKRSKIEIENRQVPENNSTDNRLSEMTFAFFYDSRF